MIEKYCHIPAYDPVHGQQVFVLPVNDIFEKTASIVKEAQVSEEIKTAIDAIKPERGHRYVLVNGIGAGEFWSSNKNADYFPETGLKYGGDDYGYRTFLSGHNFCHHQNKDPHGAVGCVKFAHYNDRMHRVELVLDTDLSKLAEKDPEIHEKVAHGQPVDVSMGSKCDFDLCSICSHKSANRSEYCDHLAKYGNTIMSDGRKVYAYTPHPRFFDISYVTKGADVTAKMLQYLDKAASDLSEPAGSRKTAASAVSCPDPSLHETASCEPGYETPEFEKDHLAAVALLEATEPRLDPATLDAMAKIGYNEALSTASHFGVVLSPSEYQRLTLVSIGEKKLAEKLALENAVIDVFSAGSWFDPSVKTLPAQTSQANLSPKIASLLADRIPERTIFEPFFSERLKKAVHLPDRIVEKLARARDLEKDAATFMTPEIAAALALGYIIYRKGIPTVDVEALQKAIHDPQMSRKILMVLIPLIAAGSVIDKVISFEPPTRLTQEKKADIASKVLLPFAGTYLYSAYARKKAERGEPISGIEHMYAQYPLPLTLGTIGALYGLKPRMKGTMGKRSDMISVGMRKQSQTELALAIGSGIYRPRASGALAYLADVAIGSALAAGAKKVFGTRKSQSA